jgi:hypothetical protein
LVGAVRVLVDGLLESSSESSDASVGVLVAPLEEQDEPVQVEEELTALPVESSTVWPVDVDVDVEQFLRPEQAVVVDVLLIT